MTKLRVFLADDHAVVREGLKALINAETGMTVVGEAADGQVACKQVPALRPDVVVMDVSMPGLTGSQAMRDCDRNARPFAWWHSLCMKIKVTSASFSPPVRRVMC